MAKYTITHTCGHTEEVQLFGPYKDRESRIKWLESKPCPDCIKAAATQAANEASAERGLAPLTGTDKQTAWAVTIREGVYKCIDMLAGVADKFGNAEATKMVAGWTAELDKHTEAKWWIDNRDKLPTYTNESSARSAIYDFNNLFNKDPFKK